MLAPLLRKAEGQKKERNSHPRIHAKGIKSPTETGQALNPTRILQPLCMPSPSPHSGVPRHRESESDIETSRGITPNPASHNGEACIRAHERCRHSSSPLLLYVRLRSTSLRPLSSTWSESPPCFVVAAAATAASLSFYLFLWAPSPFPLSLPLCSTLSFFSPARDSFFFTRFSFLLSFLCCLSWLCVSSFLLYPFPLSIHSSPRRISVSVCQPLS